MKTVGKFSLFMILLLAAACVSKKKSADVVDETTLQANSAEKEAKEEADLQTDCFEGDPAACDELGH